jgi:hypothetical protein
MLKRRKAREAILGIFGVRNDSKISQRGTGLVYGGTYLGPNSAYLGLRAPGAQKGWQWSHALHGRVVKNSG